MKKIRKMVKNLRMIKKALFLLLFIFMATMNFFAQEPANMGTEFYVAFGRNDQIMEVKEILYDGKIIDNLQLSLRITTADEADVTFHFTENPLLNTIVHVYPGVTDYILTRPQAQASYTSYHPADSDPPNKKSIIVTATASISLIATSSTHASVETTLVLPVQNLGKEYLHVGNERYQVPTAPYHSNGYVIVATENNTVVTQYTTQLQVGVNIVRTMNKGDVFFYGNTDHLGWNPMGAHIVADKPIAFFQNGTRTQLGTYAANRNYTFEQIPPVEQFGTKFILPTNDLSAGYVRLYPKDDGEIVTVNVVYSDNKVETYVIDEDMQVSYNRHLDIMIDLEHFSANPPVNSCYITTDKPVSATAYNIPRYKGNDQTAQPGAAWLPPIEQTTHSVLVSPINFDGNYMYLATRHYFLIIVPTASKNKTMISINGGNAQPISDVSPTTFNWIQDNIGGSEYSFGRYYFGETSHFGNNLIAINTVALVENPDGLIMLAYGQGSYANYFYSVGSGALDLDLSFHVNDIHHEDIYGMAFCEKNYEIKAKYRMKPAADASYPRWFFDGSSTDDLNGRGHGLTNSWLKKLSPGIHTVRMEFKDEDNVIHSRTTMFDVCDSPVIGAIDMPSLCEDETLNLAAPTVEDNNNVILDNGWEIETSVGSNSYTKLTMPYSVKTSELGKRVRYWATNECGIGYSDAEIMACKECQDPAEIEVIHQGIPSENE